MIGIAALAACGGSGDGGSGGSSTPPPVQPGALQFGSATHSADEASTVVTITVTRTGGSDGAVSASLTTADGTAIGGQDFSALVTTVSFAAGDSAAKTFDIAITDDALAESAETFTATLSAPTGGATLGAAVTATITIEDDDTVGPPPSAGNGLNDTGVTSCSNGVNNGVACNDATVGTDQYPGQDAEHGRDATTNDDSDGHAGFSFTRLDAGGAPLADQSTMFSSSPWDCVLDNVTGLTWEIKTDDDGLRDKDWTYSWFSTSGSDNDGHEGVASGGVCVDTITCDTQQYVAAINSAALCGREDWRMPTRMELLSLVDYGVTTAPLIGLDHLPNLGADAYWSASSAGGDAWGFAGGTAWGVDFENGKMQLAPKRSARAVRLVSGAGSQ